MYKVWRAALSIAAILGTHETMAGREAIGNDAAAVVILALGTSLTVNYLWPHELAKQLSTCLGRTVRIEIRATAGANSSQAKVQFDSRGHLRPDIVLIEFSSNDADFLDGVSLDKGRGNHIQLLAHIRANDARTKVILMTMSPAFGIRGWIRPQLADYYQMYRETAANNEALLVDIAPVWTGLLVGNRYKEQLPDGLHPTQTAASRVILPVLRSRISELIEGDKKSCGDTP